MSKEIQAAQDFRVNTGTHEDGGVREQSEVEMLDDGEQHPDVGLQEEDEHTQKKLPAVKRSCFRVFKVTLGVLYLVILAGITTRYILVTLENQQLKTKISDTTANMSQLQRDYDELSKNHSQLQEEVKKLKDEIKGTCTDGWMRFGCRCYFKSTERKTWLDSRRDCEDKGADLVIINSEEEQKFIHENMTGESWIGLRYDYNQGTWEWKWLDGSSLTKMFWEGKELDSSEWNYAACCDSDGKWTRPHYSEYKSWICEK